VIGPILDVSFGKLAPLVMAGLCLTAYLFGGAIRFNIARLGSGEGRSSLEDRVEVVASWSLAFAYVISVAYYLNLLGAFAVSMTSLDDSTYARIVTTGMFIVILSVGWTRGFGALEKLEQVSVGLKLAIIAGLLVGLAWFFGKEAAQNELVFAPPSLSGWAALTLMFGLLVTVQGFETSRYLGVT
jgi:amino acid transporter